MNLSVQLDLTHLAVKSLHCAAASLLPVTIEAASIYERASFAVATCTDANEPVCIFGNALYQLWQLSELLQLTIFYDTL